MSVTSRARAVAAVSEAMYEHASRKRLRLWWRGLSPLDFTAAASKIVNRLEADGLLMKEFRSSGLMTAASAKKIADEAKKRMREAAGLQPEVTPLPTFKCPTCGEDVWELETSDLSVIRSERLSYRLRPCGHRVAEVIGDARGVCSVRMANGDVWLRDAETPPKPEDGVTGTGGQDGS